MNQSLSLALSSIKTRPLTSALSAFSVGCGITLLCSIFLLANGLEKGISKNAQNIDLIIGAHGSPLQLVLSSIYQADVPSGNIEMADAQKWMKHPQIRKAIPLAFGDSYKGWRVVGTTADYLSLYGLKPKSGRAFEKPFEVVAGSAVPLKIGDKFAAAHGFSADSDDIHDFHLYEVVGILAPSGTVADKLILTPYESVQQLHAHHDEAEHHEEHDHHHDSPEEEAAGEALGHQITALLIQVRSPMAIMTLPRHINKEGHMLAAVPSYEMARLSTNLGFGKDLVLVLSIGIVFLSGLMLFSSLSSGLALRQYDLAILRVLGASPATVLATVLWEGVLIGLAGAVLGIVTGHGLAYLIAANLDTLQGFVNPQAMLGPGLHTLYWLALGGIVGGLAALLPASSTARLDIAALLAKGNI